MKTSMETTMVKKMVILFQFWGKGRGANPDRIHVEEDKRREMNAYLG
jgi:hypothetical protein